MRRKDTLNLGEPHRVVYPLVSVVGQMFQIIHQEGEGLKGLKVEAQSNHQTNKLANELTVSSVPLIYPFIL